MNAPLRHPLPWTAVVQPFMNGREPVIRPNGKPLVYNSADVAKAIAKGFPGATTIDMGRSPVEPTVEAIREAANASRAVPVTFCIEDMDGWKTAHESPYRHGGR